jgi:hypothetical protein
MTAFARVAALQGDATVDRFGHERVTHFQLSNDSFRPLNGQPKSWLSRTFMRSLRLYCR